MESNRKEEGKSNFEIKAEWISQSSALKSRYPKLLNEDKNFDSEKEKYLFI